jgi:hypothetical protein
VTGGETYAISGYTTANKTVQHACYWYEKADGTTAIGSMTEWQGNGRIVVAPANAKYLRAVYRYSDNSTPTLEDMRCQVERGSTATEYEPYHHTTTPIPLPSRGWVGSLPDGTHDALSIDGAGKVTWKLGIGKYVVTGSETIDGTRDLGTNYRIVLMRALQNFAVLGNDNLNGLCDRLVARVGYDTDATGFYYNLSANKGHIFCFVPNVETTADALAAMTGAEFYYPLSSTTEVMGYVDLPDIPDGAVVSMPELEGFGVESWTGDAIARYVRAWAARS